MAACTNCRIAYLEFRGARERVRVARALAELPKLDALFGRGELSYSRVRAITRVATPATEQDLIDVGLHSTASQLERVCRSYQGVVDSAGKSGAELKRQRRYVRRSDPGCPDVLAEAGLGPRPPPRARPTPPGQLLLNFAA